MQHGSRKIYGPPILQQDWGDEVDEGAVKYWELFLDLLMVAAASSVADGLKENPTIWGVLEFLCTGLLMINGWMYYTHHYTTRFEDNTLIHSFILFVFCVGNGLAIVGASYETYQQFSLGSILQRMSMVVMFLTVFCCIPRARDFAVVFMVFCVYASFLFLLSVCIPTCVQLFWWAALVPELLQEFLLVRFLPGSKLVPVNIEHTKDRLGCLILIMLGETVISSTISYREYAKEEQVEDIMSYYWVLGLAFLLIFNFTLLFFHMQPPPEDHAFRRSRQHGCWLLLAHKFLGISLLCVGVGVKLAVKAAVEGEEMSKFGANLMGISVGTSFAILFFMRILHYGGIYPRGTEPQWAINLMKFWWGLFAFMVTLPFLMIFVVGTHPVAVIAPFSIQIFIMCVFESGFTHFLGPFFVRGEGEEGKEQSDHVGEKSKLVGSESTALYNSGG